VDSTPSAKLPKYKRQYSAGLFAGPRRRQ
jgi:hypothetical protein